MNDLKNYLQENNLPDFITTWQEVADFTGKTLVDLIGETKTAPATVKNKQAATPTPIAAPGNLEQLLAAALNPYLNTAAAPIDENTVIELIKKHAPVRHIEIKTNTEKTTIPGLQHEKFEQVLKMIAAGLNLYLYGPAGTGKTQLAESAAIALNKPFYCISVCAQSTKSDLLGFMNAGGQYVKTLFREAYENGGVYLIDEIDNGNPNILAVLNSALANGYCAFPDGMIKRHNDFICIAAANTFGTGADRQYVGRTQLDASTLNRFVQLEVNYDENLEFSLYGEIAKDIQAIRAKLAGERVIISMRNTANTARLIATGFTKKEALQLAVINTIPENLKSKLK